MERQGKTYLDVRETGDPPLQPHWDPNEVTPQEAVPLAAVVDVN